MEITYLGHACFRIKGKEATVITDPFDPEIVGYEMPKVKADVVTISHEHGDHNYLPAITGAEKREAPFVIRGPGEYEASQVYVVGWPTFHDEEKGAIRGKNTIYSITFEGISLCHLGDLGHKLSDKQAEDLGQTNVLFVPVGGPYSLKAREALPVIDQLNPQIVIPMHYRLPGSKIELAGLEEFFAAAELEKKEAVEKLVVKADELPEERQIVVLEKRG